MPPLDAPPPPPPPPVLAPAPDVRAPVAPRTRALIGGGVTLGAGYVLSVVWAGIEYGTDSGRTAASVAGVAEERRPELGFAFLPVGGPVAFYLSDPNDARLPMAILGSTAQLAGLATLIAAPFLSAEAPDGTAWQVIPQGGPDGVGVQLIVRR